MRAPESDGGAARAGRTRAESAGGPGDRTARPSALGQRLAATGELLERYRQIWLLAWRARSPLDGRRYSIEEAQFLPAALALAESPVSPAPRLAMRLIMGFALLALLWSIFGRIDIVATAQGKVVPSDGTKAIQPLVTARVRAIHVREGQSVRAGELLMELDPTEQAADQEKVAGELLRAQLSAAHAQALLAALTAQRAPQLDAPPGVEGARLDEARAHLAGQYAEYAVRLQRLDAEKVTRQAELRAGRELLTRYQHTAPIARKRADDLVRLRERGFVSQHTWLEREQAAVEQEGDLAAQRAQVERLQAVLAELERQREVFVAETRRSWLDDLQEAMARAEVLRQERVKADFQHRHTRLVAPVDGSVQQLAVHTVGGVVTPAQPLMLLVPRDHPLEVEAYLENKDVGFVRVGQTVEIKLETFSYTKYGTLVGQVSQVSRDAIADEQRGLVYALRVVPERFTLDVDGRPASLAPGMAATVEIKIGRRRVIEFFLAPLLQRTGESLHER